MITGILGFILIAGSYGAENDTTIRTFNFNPETGTATPVTSLTGLTNPSFLAGTADGAVLLAANENDGPSAGLTVLRRTPDGGYERTGFQASDGNGPCHVAIAPNGRYAVTSNYTGGSISIFPFDAASPSLGAPQVIQFHGSGADKERQDQPHAHFTTFSPDGRLMITDDLGTDCLHTFPLDNAGFPIIESMSDVHIAAGAGPRHLTFAPDGSNAYLINELDGTVTHLEYDSTTATLTPKESILADFRHGHGSADIHLSPDGRFLYVSNRLKGDGIAIFAVDETTGTLSPAGFMPTGRHPRNFTISPDGKWILVAVRDDNRIEIYSRDNNTGTLSPRGAVEATRPVCLIWQ